MYTSSGILFYYYLIKIQMESNRCFNNSDQDIIHMYNTIHHFLSAT